jgi:hypothetical protein
MDPLTLTEFNILSGPSLFERFQRYYGLSEDVINSYIGEHSLSLENAAKILSNYGPVYEGKLGSNTLPMRKLEQVKGKGVPINAKYPVYPTGYEGLENGEGYNPLLKNRANGLIVNNFYGVPYITEGNRLMFL